MNFPFWFFLACLFLLIFDRGQLLAKFSMHAKEDRKYFKARCQTVAYLWESLSGGENSRLKGISIINVIEARALRKDLISQLRRCGILINHFS